MTAPATALPAIEGPTARRRWWTARRILVAGLVLALAPLFIVALQRGFALPPAPEEIWAVVDGKDFIKPWASACRSPGGEPWGCSSWFEDSAGNGAADWNERLLVVLYAPTPLGRKAVHAALTGSSRGDTFVARYRFTGERRVVEGKPWGRYVPED